MKPKNSKQNGQIKDHLNRMVRCAGLEVLRYLTCEDQKVHEVADLTYRTASETPNKDALRLVGTRVAPCAYDRLMPPCTLR